MEKKQKIPIKLLYVEDETVIREQLERLLNRVVKYIRSAQNGQEGLEVFKEYRPDIVLTDIKMPIMSGLEMAKKIREIDKRVPIIITTAHNESDFLLDAITTGVQDFLLKPVDADKLISILEAKGHDIMLEREIEREHIRFETMLNFQDSMILLANQTDIEEVNKSFLDFFGCENLDEFKARYKDLEHCFQEKDCDIEASTTGWMAKLLSDEHEKNTAKLIDKNGIQHTFLLKATKVPTEEEVYIISMSDISEMEKEAEELERLASTDPLTKIYNRLKLNQMLLLEVARCSRYKTPLSLIMFDIDHFKEVNDHFGHDVGDGVLIKMAQVVSDSVRHNDVFARWGGEEFMVMLPNTDIAGAEKLAENLRQLIETTAFDICGTITASFGVSEYQNGENVKAVLKRVDDALYESKRNGRNRVSLLS